MAVFSLEAASERLAQIDRERDGLAQDAHVAEPGAAERLAALDRERVLLVDLIRAIHDYERVTFPHPRSNPRQHHPRPNLRQHHAKGSKAYLITWAVEHLIAGLGRPVRTREIRTMAKMLGLRLPASGFPYEFLTRSPHLKLHPDLGWWSSDWPWPDTQQ